jgi:hypothetical protein
MLTSSIRVFGASGRYRISRYASRPETYLSAAFGRNIDRACFVVERLTGGAV